MPLAIRRLVPILFALLLLAGTTPGVAAFTARFPNQSLGNRGADVTAIQGLLRSARHLVVADGIFGTDTQDGVKVFQATRGLLPDGTVGDATWLQLIVPLSLNRTGEAVLVLQRQLNAKRNAGLASTAASTPRRATPSSPSRSTSA